jgi:predicted metal-dependent hydrolase
MPAEPTNLHESEIQLFLKGISLFNAGQFFEAHEAWEDAWHMTQGIKHDFYQGMIQCAVALEHYRRSNPQGVINLARRYPAKFKDVPDLFMGLDVRSFLEQMHQMLQPIVKASPIPQKGQIHLDMAKTPQIVLINQPNP